MAPTPHPSGPGTPTHAGIDTGTPQGVPADLISELTRSILDEPLTRYLRGVPLPSRDGVAQLTEELRELMFPGFFTRRGLTEANLALHVQELVSRIQLSLEEQIRSCLRYARHIDTEIADSPDSIECDKRAADVAGQFMSTLPRIRRMLALDVRAAFKGDPAAVHTDETVFCYPGTDAIFSHRIAHELYKLGVPLLPRIIQELAHARTGIDIHPGATIGESFFVDHGAGVVIGQTSEIGNEVRIYQGVTIGATSFELDSDGQLKRTGDTKRHPTIGDRVTIYSGAIILGGDTIIGDDCVIAGSVFITKSVPPGHFVRQEQPELLMRTVRTRPPTRNGGAST